MGRLAARWALLFGFLAGFASGAWAGVPATVQPVGCYAENGCHYFVMNDIAGYRGASPQEACTNFAWTVYGWTQPTGRVIQSGGTNTGLGCQVWTASGGYYSGGGIYYAGRLATLSTCPPHSTLDGGGTTCSCDPGYFPDASGTQCVAPSNRIALTGPSRTKSLVAGPALLQTATVTSSSGAAVPAITVTVNLSGGGVVSGLTNNSGKFEFVYVPPAKATSDHLTATCGSCTNVAEKDITVDACDVCEAMAGNPIQPATGEKLQFEVDWIDSSAHPLTVTRTYRSFGTPWAGLGGNWSLPWAATAIVLDTEAQIRLGDGRRVNFRRANAQEPWVAEASADSLVATQEGFQYRRASDGVSYVFDLQGRLIRIVQRNGWAMGVQRDASGRVASVTNAFGRSLALSYDAANRLTAITTPDGSRIVYGSDASGNLVAVTYPGGSSRGYLYEISGAALTGIVDERGVRVATFAYEASGRAISTQHAGAQSFGVSYAQAPGPRGQLVAGASIDPGIYRTQATVTDPLGTPRTYEWVGGDGHVYMVGASSAGGLSGFASRGMNNLPTHETDFAGVSTTFTWDPVRRVKIAQTEAAGRAEARTTSTQWHPVFDLPVRITEPGRVTDFTYDGWGNKLSETVADSASGVARTRRWTYTPSSLVATETDEAGRTTQYGYDAVGNRTSMTDAAGQVTTYAFDAAGRVIRQTDPAGVETAYGYDARGRLVSQARAGETTSYAYTATGQLSRVTTPNGYQVTFGYDAADRLVAATDSRGTSVQYVLDGAGHRIREEVKDANGNIVLAATRTVDALGRIAATQGAAGETTQYGHDANGEPVSTTDPLNNTTRQTLDALRRVTTITFPDNASATQTVNALDSVTQVIDPKGVATRYEVNAFGEVLSETSPDIGTSTFVRNDAGEVTASTDARGKTRRITRDALGRPVEVADDDQTQLFAYDAQGNVSRIQDGSGSTVYTRDAHGRVLTKTQTVNDNATNPSRYTLQYGYTNGDLTSIRYPSGMVVSYRRSGGRITQIDVQRPGNAQQTFLAKLVHTPLGQPKSWSWYNGDTATRSFDANGRMVANEFATYTWDAADRITGITQKLWTANGTQLAQTPITWSVGYDSRNRITSMARAGHSTSFTYDANSNRIARLEIASGELDLEAQFDSPAIGLSTSETPKIEASSNRLLGFQITATASGGGNTSTVTNDVNFEVDQAGNTTSDGLRTFRYNAANRLSKVIVGRGSDALAHEYLHNALGQRVFKSDAMLESSQSPYGNFSLGFLAWVRSTFGWLYNSLQPKSQTGLAFVYDEQGNLLSTHGNGSNYGSRYEMEYIWLPLDNGSSIPVGVYRNWQFHPVHTDHLGTPRLMTDAFNKPVWQWPYSAFGANKATGVLSTVTTTTAAGVTTTQLKATTPGFDHMLRFPGQYCDLESALCYNWWRYYFDGRYRQADPLGKIAGLNEFIYVEGSPLLYTDRRGLDRTVWSPGPGRTVFDGPRNGNWGGGRWSGAAAGGKTGKAPPTDSADECYMRHDLCYDAGGSVAQCDAKLVEELLALPFDPRLWPMPPSRETEADTIRFLNGALMLFKR